MDHNIHGRAPSLWSYGAEATVAQNHWTVPNSNRQKRSISDSDCDDIFSEESSKEQISPSQPGSCQLMSRKKRRGVIEKKRRDRINSSLSELKRLVPTAYEKQGSAKLEKAEILQLTVEHLKALQSKGIDGYNIDPQRVAMDYHIIGFRECAAEVARYLVTIEGMNIQDPLRLRLMSHLQYFVQQRELSVKACTNSNNWSASSSVSAAYSTNCAVTSYQAYNSSPGIPNTVTSYVPTLSSPIQPYPALSSSPNRADTNHLHHPYSIHSSRVNTSAGPASNDTMSIGNQANIQQIEQQTNHSHNQTNSQDQQSVSNVNESHHQQTHFTQDQNQLQETTYIELTNAPNIRNQRNSNSALPPETNSFNEPIQYAATANEDYISPSIHYVAVNGSKPYRPWGAEMAY